MEGQYPNNDLINNILTKSFAETNKEVYNMGVDIRFSGSTCVSVLTFGKKLYVANVGDSRAVLISANNATDSQCQVKALSRDHKPEDPIEAKTILENNGRIDSYRD